MQQLENKTQQQKPDSSRNPLDSAKRKLAVIESMQHAQQMHTAGKKTHTASNWESVKKNSLKAARQSGVFSADEMSALSSYLDTPKAHKQWVMRKAANLVQLEQMKATGPLSLITSKGANTEPQAKHWNQVKSQMLQRASQSGQFSSADMTILRTHLNSDEALQNYARGKLATLVIGSSMRAAGTAASDASPKTWEQQKQAALTLAKESGQFDEVEMKALHKALDSPEAKQQFERQTKVNELQSEMRKAQFPNAAKTFRERLNSLQQQ